MRLLTKPSQDRISEAKEASLAAKLSVTMLTIGFCFLSFWALSEPLRMTQQAALKTALPVKVDLSVKPMQIERDWVLMTVPDSVWQVRLKEDEPVIKKENKPLIEKPVVKKTKSAKPTEVKPKVVQKSVGSAQKATSTQGSSGSENPTAVALKEIVDVIERHKRYPKRARDTGLEGITHLKVVVGSDGRVTHYGLEEGGNALFRRATMDAARALNNLQTSAKKAVALVIPVRYEMD